MKVNTDSLVLGSWAEPRPTSGGMQRILDIGTGSGILALMMAQKAQLLSPKRTENSGDEPQSSENQKTEYQTSIIIDAIEIDESAAKQAASNFKNAKWANQLFIYHCDVCAFMPPHQYKLIISNPPYFDSPTKKSNAYNAQTHARNVARQTSTLDPAGLLKASYTLLESQGDLYCVYPFSMESTVCQTAASEGFALEKLLYVRHTPDKQPYLCAFHFRKVTSDIKTVTQDSNALSSMAASKKTLTIRNAQGEYTCEYKALCQPFYLKF
ncbi:tRNA1(Val) (adenine(37)-N6)-methyltransferase [Alteromonas gracilis]|uniref:tRNA1(Val) (adenine(37)-N6)-methyltransferase n=1 Tax=Alteromonas gracilis TaxID=1479524 RepID=UPI003735E8EE